MIETTEVVKIRISSLEHTRQLVAVLAGSLTAVYTAIGIFSANQGLLIDNSQASWSLFCPAWNLFVFGLFLTIALTNLCFILAVFLLTDSIHNYSKILEYQSDLFENAMNESIQAHQRALASDDLSYFYVRVGTFFITFNLFLVAIALVTRQIPTLPVYAVILGILACGLLAFFFVLSCYRVSHYKIPEHSLGKSITRFWNPGRWRDAIKASRGNSDNHARKMKQ